MRTLYGNVSADGSRLSGQGFTVTKGGTGTYNISFTQSFQDGPAIVGNCTEKSIEDVVYVKAIGTSGATICTGTTYQTGQLFDRGFTFIVVGG